MLKANHPRSIFDVARYILKKTIGEIPSNKLQMLCYLCEAWSLVTYEKSLIEDGFYAYRHGPACSKLLDKLKETPMISLKSFKAGNEKNLLFSERRIIDMVLKDYGYHTVSDLFEIMREDLSFQIAIKDLKVNKVRGKKIRKDLMQAFYAGFLAGKTR